jgi:hypothetical protein
LGEPVRLNTALPDERRSYFSMNIPGWSKGGRSVDAQIEHCAAEGSVGKSEYRNKQ